MGKVAPSLWGRNFQPPLRKLRARVPPTLARRPRPASPLLPRGFAAWPASGSRDREARRVYREQNVARLRPPLRKRREPGPGARGREAPSGRGRGAAAGRRPLSLPRAGEGPLSAAPPHPPRLSEGRAARPRPALGSVRSSGGGGFVGKVG